jgi:uncharacterized protein with PIN domain
MKQMRELERWLRRKCVEAERTARRYGKAKNYGAAQLALGHAEAYAFAALQARCRINAAPPARSRRGADPSTG